MMIEYDTQFDPPALITSIVIAGVVHRRPRVELSALIDTGADVTAIPQSLVDKLKLYPVGRMQLEDANAVKTLVFTYVANVTLAEEPARRMEVVVTPYPFVILGRDWLSEYYLLLDGPGQHYRISKSPLHS